MAAAYPEIAAAIAATGLLARGGFHPDADDAVPLLPGGRAARTLVLVGNAGPSLWQHFAPFLAQNPDAPNPLNAWVMQAVDGIARRFGAAAVFTYEGPPFHPFLRWAQRAEAVHPSPIGLLIHPVYGLWHAYRAALLFAEEIELPAVTPEPAPCETCADKPCLAGGPVEPRQREGFDVARRACPVGRAFTYGNAQSAFHQAAFLGRRT